jgi:hypothetical protein
LRASLSTPLSKGHSIRVLFLLLLFPHVIVRTWAAGAFSPFAGSPEEGVGPRVEPGDGARAVRRWRARPRATQRRYPVECARPFNIPPPPQEESGNPGRRESSLPA